MKKKIENEEDRQNIINLLSEGDVIGVIEYIEDQEPVKTNFYRRVIDGIHDSLIFDTKGNIITEKSESDFAMPDLKLGRVPTFTSIIICYGSIEQMRMAVSELEKNYL